jgi:hypothetical protein
MSAREQTRDWRTLVGWRDRADGMGEKRTGFILRLVPLAIAPDILLLLLLLVSLLAEHLVEEAELRLCGEEESAEDHEERGQARHNRKRSRNMAGLWQCGSLVRFVRC